MQLRKSFVVRLRELPNDSQRRPEDWLPPVPSASSLADVPQSRLINTTAPLAGGGDLTVDRTLSISMTTARLLGRSTAGAGVAEEILLGTNLSFTGLTLNAAGGGGSVPTGTGFTHITAGAQDAAAKLVDTADINADAVTYAKMQNVSVTARLLGRITAGAGDTEELTGTQVTTLLDVVGALKGLMSAADKTKLDGVATGATANATDAALRDRALHTGTQAIATILAAASARFFGRITAAGGAGEEMTGTQATTLLDVVGALKGLMSAADKTKLDGVAAGATANSTDAVLLARANHTGTQAGSTVTGLYTVAGMTLNTARLLGRTTAAAGAAEEISVGAGLTLVTGVLDRVTQTTVTGNAGSATVLATPRNISITGKATAAGGNFDGSAALVINITAVTLVAGDIPNIAQSQVTNLVTDLGNKQPLDTQLTDIAALLYTANAGKVITVNAGATAFELQTPTAPPAAPPTFTTVEISIDAPPRRSGKFTIPGAGMVVGKPVFIQQAVGPYTGKGARADEAEMDIINVTASVTAATEITCYWTSQYQVAGTFKFDYLIGA